MYENTRKIICTQQISNKSDDICGEACQPKI